MREIGPPSKHIPHTQTTGVEMRSSQQIVGFVFLSGLVLLSLTSCKPTLPSPAATKQPSSGGRPASTADRTFEDHLGRIAFFGSLESRQFTDRIVAAAVHCQELDATRTPQPKTPASNTAAPVSQQQSRKLPSEFDSARALRHQAIATSLLVRASTIGPRLEAPQQGDKLILEEYLKKELKLLQGKVAELMTLPNSDSSFDLAKFEKDLFPSKDGAKGGRPMRSLHSHVLEFLATQSETSGKVIAKKLYFSSDEDSPLCEDLALAVALVQAKSPFSGETLDAIPAVLQLFSLFDDARYAPSADLKMPDKWQDWPPLLNRYRNNEKNWKELKEAAILWERFGRPFAIKYNSDRYFPAIAHLEIRRDPTSKTAACKIPRIPIEAQVALQDATFTQIPVSREAPQKPLLIHLPIVSTSSLREARVTDPQRWSALLLDDHFRHSAETSLSGSDKSQILISPSVINLDGWSVTFSDDTPSNADLCLALTLDANSQSPLAVYPPPTQKLSVTADTWNWQQLISSPPLSSNKANTLPVNLMAKPIEVERTELQTFIWTRLPQHKDRNLRFVFSEPTTKALGIIKPNEIDLSSAGDFSLPLHEKNTSTAKRLEGRVFAGLMQVTYLPREDSLPTRGPGTPASPNPLEVTTCLGPLKINRISQDTIDPSLVRVSCEIDGDSLKTLPLIVQDQIRVVTFDSQLGQSHQVDPQALRDSFCANLNALIEEIILGEVTERLGAEITIRENLSLVIKDKNVLLRFKKGSVPWSQLTIPLEANEVSILDWNNTSISGSEAFIEGLGIKHSGRLGFFLPKMTIKEFSGKPLTWQSPCQERYWAATTISVSIDGMERDLRVLLPKASETLAIDWRDPESFRLLCTQIDSMKQKLELQLAPNDKTKEPKPSPFDSFISLLSTFGVSANDLIVNVKPQYNDNKGIVIKCEATLSATVEKVVVEANATLTLSLDPCNSTANPQWEVKLPSLNTLFEDKNVFNQLLSQLRTHITKLKYAVGENEFSVKITEGQILNIPQDLEAVYLELSCTAGLLKGTTVSNVAFNINSPGLDFKKATGKAHGLEQLEDFCKGFSGQYIKVSPPNNNSIHIHDGSVTIPIDVELSAVALTALSLRPEDNTKCKIELVVSFIDRKLSAKFESSTGSVEDIIWNAARNIINEALRKYGLKRGELTFGKVVLTPTDLDVRLDDGGFTIAGSVDIKVNGTTFCGLSSLAADIVLRYGNNNKVTIESLTIRPSAMQLIQDAISAVAESFGCSIPIPTWNNSSKTLTFKIKGKVLSAVCELTLELDERKLTAKSIAIDYTFQPPGITLTPTPLAIHKVKGSFDLDGVEKGKIVACVEMGLAGDSSNWLLNLNGEISANVREFKWIEGELTGTVLYVIPVGRGITRADWGSRTTLKTNIEVGKPVLMSYAGDLNIEFDNRDKWNASLTGDWHLLSKKLINVAATASPESGGVLIDVNADIDIPQVGNTALSLKSKIPATAKPSKHFSFNSVETSIHLELDHQLAAIGVAGKNIDVRVAGQIDGILPAEPSGQTFSVKVVFVVNGSSFDAPKFTINSLDELANELKQLAKAKIKLPTSIDINNLTLRPRKHDPGAGGDGPKGEQQKPVTSTPFNRPPEGPGGPGTPGSTGGGGGPGGSNATAILADLNTSIKKAEFTEAFRATLLSAPKSAELKQSATVALQGWVEILQSASVLEANSGSFDKLRSEVTIACEDVLKPSSSPKPLKSIFANYLRDNYTVDGMGLKVVPSEGDTNGVFKQTTPHVSMALLALSEFAEDAQRDDTNPLKNTQQAMLRYLVVNQSDSGTWGYDANHIVRDWPTTQLALLAIRRTIVRPAIGPTPSGLYVPYPVLKKLRCLDISYARMEYGVGHGNTQDAFLAMAAVGSLPSGEVTNISGENRFLSSLLKSEPNKLGAHASSPPQLHQTYKWMASYYHYHNACNCVALGLILDECRRVPLLDDQKARRKEIIGAVVSALEKYASHYTDLSKGVNTVDPPFHIDSPRPTEKYSTTYPESPNYTPMLFQIAELIVSRELGRAKDVLDSLE